jgi:hypothetical protein
MMAGWIWRSVFSLIASANKPCSSRMWNWAGTHLTYTATYLVKTLLVSHGDHAKLWSFSLQGLIYLLSSSHIWNITVITKYWIYLLTFLLTYSLEQSPSWEANRFSTSQEVPCIFWNPNFITAFTFACHLPYPEPAPSSFTELGICAAGKFLKSC